MFLRRLSILGSMLLAACVPSLRIDSPIVVAPNCYNFFPSKTEQAAWRAALRANTASAYRSFIRTYPRSCYVPAATARISTAVEKKPVTVRNVPRTVVTDVKPRTVVTERRPRSAY
jgi:hypothetical protein